ncbi:hypothetical protein CANARDRAFT_23158 [[Candida] arabinofermentans NRRL YB-2248]|uniref:Non-canonical E2 ubiquitin-conjugating enzyme C-terminal domain-containing protein n=1 Tax=[Candida] arabinofermentans NRRL YB-2248 TaxID=983967 RepID=A0A1E4T1J0_9ASCO|nr:hypothetical protein CANARDRAFT_23158 [[Candida] arabinofermentans NRRL YB-2248]
MNINGMDQDKKTLAQLLEANDEELDLIDVQKAKDKDLEDKVEDDVDDEDDDDKFDPNFCIDCKHMPTEIKCLTCNEPFCKVCFQFVHKSGSRKHHEIENVEKEEAEVTKDEVDNDDEDELDDDDDDDEGDSTMKEETDPNAEIHTIIMNGIKKNSKFIPMRLTYEERQLLKLLEAALSVSEYTDRVDILSYKSKTKRIVEQLREMCSILAGLVVSSNMKIGQKLIQDKNFEDNAEWYQTVFEVGRRYKIMNPERMRDTFGKLSYIIMDSRLPEVKDHMEFDLYAPIKTVHSYILQKGGFDSLELLNDPLIMDATAEIRPEGKSRMIINRQIRQKESAIERMSSKYTRVGGLTREDIRQILYSIGDFNSYTNKNRLPVIRTIKRLDEFFKDSGSSTKYSLGIRYGQSGARLTHKHEKQYLYVKQALELWSHVMRDMIELWSAADEDLFNGQKYQLTNTGQGLNRVKSCPVLYKKMYNILYEVQRKFDYWVGTPVIHLGDDAVPNALFFLDKYIQIPSILIPIDRCIEDIDVLAKDPYLEKYMIDQFGSIEDLKKTIMCDYFKHGFDGSGADNFYFAGSCVDAASTSSCEFCNNISKKDYYRVFMLTGFTNFNGEGY